MKNSKTELLLVGLFFFLLMILVGVGARSSDGQYANTLEAPVLSDPTNVKSTSFEISWSDVQDADVYLLDVASSADFKAPVEGYSKKMVEVTNASVEGLKAGVTYYVRVFAKNEAETSAASKEKQVLTVTKVQY
jgi:hypothetical protein